MTDSLFMFIMAGGSGERFWPLSRSRLPKHLVRLFENRTLLESTCDRISGLAPASQTFILTNEQQAAPCRDCLPAFSATQIIAEPEKRDTAPAAALATGLALAKNPEAIVVLLPADAMIRDHATFRKQLNEAIAMAQSSDALVTFAIQPSYPATGFGYLELELAPLPENSSFFNVKRFVEKPDRATAESYLASGQFGWNAGIFVWKAKVFLREAEKLQPELAKFIKEFPANGSDTYIRKQFGQLPKISVDYAIMEKASRVIAVRSKFDWDDVGTWTALPGQMGQDANHNTIQGNVVVENATGNIAVSSKRVIALCGVENLVVVETNDAILVCHRDAVQDVKKLLPKLPPEVR